MTAPRRRATVRTEEVSETGECVLLEPSEGRVLALNPLGAAVWDLLDGARSQRELARLLCEVTGVDAARAEADVEALLADLQREGFLA